MFQLARAPEGARDSSRELRSKRWKLVFQLARAPEGARDRARIGVQPGLDVSTRAGSRGSPRYPCPYCGTMVDEVSTRAGSRGSPRLKGRTRGSPTRCFNSRGLPREPAISPVQASEISPVLVSTRAGSRGSPRWYGRTLLADGGRGFNSRGLPREPAMCTGSAQCPSRSSFNSRGLPREPAIVTPAPATVAA